ncbi:MAG: MFS transporter [Dehalococcoidia bacterium]|nr:MFS transporter [Dehalococcoidia bacterium]
MGSWFSATFSALSNQQFRTVWVGTLLAFISFFMSTVAQAIVAFDLTGKNSAVGVVVFGQGLGQMIFGPIGGAAADRFSKRMVVMVCQAAITFAFGAVGVLLVFDWLTVWLLALSSFIVGSAFGFLGPARTSLMVEYVGPEKRGNAVALSQVALNASRVVGPAIVGGLIAIFFVREAGAYLVMAGLYAASLVTTWILPPSPRDGFRSAGRNVFTDMAVGMRYVWQIPRLRLFVLSYVVVIMCGFPYVAVLPGLLENELGQDEGALTIVYTATAAGGLVASLAVASLADSKLASIVYPAMALLFGVTLIATGLSPNYLAVIIVMFVLGIGSGGFQTLNGALVAQASDPEYFGRVLSLTFLAFAAFGLIALPVGLAADHWGERSVLVAMGAIVSGAMVLFAIAAARVSNKTEGAVAPLTGPQPGGGQ